MSNNIENSRKEKIELWMTERGIDKLEFVGDGLWGSRWRTMTSSGENVIVTISEENDFSGVEIMRHLSEITSGEIKGICPKVVDDNSDLGVSLSEDLSFNAGDNSDPFSRSAILAIYAAIQCMITNTKVLDGVMKRTSAAALLEDVMQRMKGRVKTDKTDLFKCLPGEDVAELLNALISRESQMLRFAHTIDTVVPTINHTNITAGSFHMRADESLCFTQWDEAVYSAPGWSLYLPFQGVNSLFQALERRSEIIDTHIGPSNIESIDAYLYGLRQSVEIEDLDRVDILPKSATFGLFYHIQKFFDQGTTLEEKEQYGLWLKNQLIELLSYLESEQEKYDRPPKPKESVPVLEELGPANVVTAISEFREYGSIVLRDAVSQEVISAMLSELALSKERQEEEVANGTALVVGENRFMHTPRLDGIFGSEAVIAASKVVQMLDGIFSTYNYILGSATVVNAFPGSAAQLLHRDNVDLFPEYKNMNMPSFLVSVVIPLVPLNERVGGTQIVLRSHRNRVPDDPLANRVLPDIKLGDAFLMDSALLHRGMPNLGTSPRPILIMCYQRPWYQDFQSFNAQPPCLAGDVALAKLPVGRQALLKWIERPNV